jgi:hypothetical protein
MLSRLELEGKSSSLLGYFLVGLAMVIISCWVPLLGGMLMLLISTVRPLRIFLFLGLALIVFHFIVMNLNKTIENDLFWYSQQYMDNYTAPLSDVFNDVRFGVLARVSEPVYHIFSYILSNVTAANFNVFVVVITSLIYFFPLKAIFNFSAWAKLKDRELVTLLVFMLFFGIIFTQSLHLIRQYLACVLLLAGIMSLVMGRSRSAYVIFLISCLTHNAMLVVVVLFISCSYLHRSKLNHAKMIVASAMLGGGLAIAYIVYFLFFMSGGSGRLLIDDGSVGLLVKGVDAVILVTSLVLISQRRKKFEHVLPLYSLYVAYCSFLIVAHYSVFLSLRYYFVLDFIRWIGFFIIISSMSLEKEKHAVINIGLVFMGVVYLWMRVDSSPFDYRYTVYEYLTGAASMF